MNNLEVLYEDNHIIVVVKPFNILSQSDNTKDIDMLTLVKSYIKEKYNKPGNVYLGLIHRLDRPVGGIMVFARTSKAASRLSEQVRNHTFKKTYLAVINGVNLKPKGEFIDYIIKKNDNNSYITNSKNGKKCKLTYTILCQSKEKNLSLVEINLETGRHHQIRVQFASRGHSLYGDQRYGKQDKKQIALFAHKLEFIHPVTKKVMCFVKNPPNKAPWKNFKV